MTDHRINLTLYSLDRVIEGEGLDEVIDALTAERQAQLLAAQGAARGVSRGSHGGDVADAMHRGACRIWTSPVPAQRRSLGGSFNPPHDGHRLISSSRCAGCGWTGCGGWRLPAIR